MLIDWFTVIAQLINFLILIWLLRKFLYRPILNAVDQREKRIADQIQRARDKEAEAVHERDKFLQKNEEFNSNYRSLLSNAMNEINERKDQLMEKVRAESMTLRNRLLQSFETEKKTLANEIIVKTRKEIFSISKKVLADLASKSLEEKMIETFLEKLEQQKSDELKRISSQTDFSGGTVFISTCYTVPEKWRKIIKEIVENILLPDNRADLKPIAIQYDENVEHINGIEMAINGFKFAWSISDYLSQMEQHVAGLLRKLPESERSPYSDNQDDIDSDKYNKETISYGKS